MALLKSPLMSLSELLCPLPASRDLWLARSASEWKSRFLQKGMSSAPDTARLVDGLRNSTVFDVSRDHIDTHLSYLTALYGFWGQVWSHQDLKKLYSNGRETPGNASRLL